jgi:hypothetical protein
MNRGPRIIAGTMGVMLGLAGLDHGIFEILQGNMPTGGLLIQAIGDAQQIWFHSREEAFTLIPNFLLTGLAAVA